MITAVFGNRLAIRVVAWMPSTPGMLMSIRTMSGSRRSARSMPSCPPSAIPTISTSGSKRRSLATLSRLSEMSSTIRTLILPEPAIPGSTPIGPAARTRPPTETGAGDGGSPPRIAPVLAHRAPSPESCCCAVDQPLTALLVRRRDRRRDLGLRPGRDRPWHRQRVVGAVVEDLETDPGRVHQGVVVLCPHHDLILVPGVLDERQQLGLLSGDFQDQVPGGRLRRVVLRIRLPLGHDLPVGARR